jgi:hypothetical protein
MRHRIRKSSSFSFSSSLSLVVPVPVVPEPRHDKLVLVEVFVDGTGDHLYVGKVLVEVAEALGTADQIQEHEILLSDAGLSQDVQSQFGRTWRDRQC